MNVVAREGAPSVTALPASDSRPRLWACRLFLVSLVFATFGRLIGYGYAEWDDAGTIFENPAYRSVSIDTIVNAWTTPHMAIYIPVTHTLWAFLAAAAGHATPNGYVIEAVPFRTFSLLLHSGSTLLVFELLRRVVGRTPAAVLGAALFAVHPIQAEAVAWISGEKDLLAGLFLLATLMTAIRAGEAGRERVARWTLATALLATLAMLSKPQAAIAPLMVIALLRGIAVPWRRTLAVGLPLLLPAVVVAIVARAVQPSSIVPEVAIAWRPIVALDSLGWYAMKLFVPVDFAIDYGHTPQVALALTRTYFIAGLVAAAMIAVWCLRRRQPLVVAGLAIAAIGPLPVLGLTRFDFQYYSTVADHYLYAGMFGIALAAAAIHAQMPWRAVRMMAYVILLPLATLASRQAGLWKSTDALFGHNLAVNPRALGPARVLAFRASQRGDDVTAIQMLRVTLDHYPNDPMANYNLANALIRLGHPDEAAAAFERAIATKPDYAAFRHNYAILLIKLGRLDEAEHQLEQAVRSEPGKMDSRQALGKLRALRSAQPATQPTPQAATRPAS